MPGIVDLVKAISDHVVAALAEANHPPLTDGKILLGREHVSAASSAPRIVMFPTGSAFAPKSAGGGVEAADRRLQIQHRPILTEMFSLQCIVWGTADPPDPERDFDATQDLYQQVVRSIHQIAGGAVQFETGTWADANPRNAALVRYGRAFVFKITFRTPILDKLLPYAPSDVTPGVVVKLKSGEGEPEPA